jgi:hypothetical protein
MYGAASSSTHPDTCMVNHAMHRCKYLPSIISMQLIILCHELIHEAEKALHRSLGLATSKRPCRHRRDQNRSHPDPMELPSTMDHYYAAAASSNGAGHVWVQHVQARNIPEQTVLRFGQSNLVAPPPRLLTASLRATGPKRHLSTSPSSNFHLP